MTERSTVLLAFERGLATITLNKPDRNNGLDSDMAVMLCDAAASIAARGDVQVVLLRGAGPRFCVGVDLAWLRPDAAGCAERMRATIERLNAFVIALRGLSAVVVAAVHGSAAGGGFSLMCAADLVVAQQGVVLATAYSRIGGTPDCGLSYFLPRIVGERRALELQLSSRALDGAEALALGIVQRLVPADEFQGTLDGLVSQLLAGPPNAYAATKRMTYASLDTGLPQQLDAELHAMLAAHAGGELTEGIAAFREKRAADFRRRLRGES